MNFPIPVLEDNYPIQDMYDESYLLNYGGKMDTRYVYYGFNEQELIEVMKGLSQDSYLRKQLQRRGEEIFGW